jgi:hypothetical protein
MKKPGAQESKRSRLERVIIVIVLILMTMRTTSTFTTTIIWPSGHVSSHRRLTPPCQDLKDKQLESINSSAPKSGKKFK